MKCDGNCFEKRTFKNSIRQWNPVWGLKGGFMEEKWMLTWQRLQKVWPLSTVRMPSPGEVKDGTFEQYFLWKQLVKTVVTMEMEDSGCFSLSVDSSAVDTTLIITISGEQKKMRAGDDFQQWTDFL